MSVDLQCNMSVAEVDQAILDMGYTDPLKCGREFPPNHVSMEEYKKKWDEIYQEYINIKTLISELQKVKQDPSYTPALKTDTSNRLINYVIRCFNEDKRTPEEVLRFLFAELSDLQDQKIYGLSKVFCIVEPEKFMEKARALAIARTEAMLMSLRDEDCGRQVLNCPEKV